MNRVLILVLLMGWVHAWAGPVARQLHFLEGGLRMPSAVAVEDDGTVYVLDGLQRRVVRFDAQGKPLGDIPLPVPLEAAVIPATDLALKGDRLFVADPGYHRILVFDAEGKLLMEVKPPVVEGTKPEPSAVLPGSRWLWFSDRAAHRVCRMPLSNGRKVQCYGQVGRMEGDFHFPYMLVQDSSDYLMVVDILNARIQVLSSGGDFYGTFGRFGTSPGTLYRPNGIALTEREEVAVSDAWLGTLTLFRDRSSIGPLRDTSGRVLEFDTPVGLAVHQKRFYVVEMGANRVQVLERLPDDHHRPPKEPARDDSRRDCIICHISWADGSGHSGSDAVLLPVSDEKMCLSCHHGAVMESRLRLGKGHQHPTLHQRRNGRTAGESTRFKDDRVPEAFPLAPAGHLYCGSCHTPHALLEEGQAVPRNHRNTWLRESNRNSRLCLRCHPSKANHSENQDNPLNHPLNVVLAPPPVVGAKGYPFRKELQRGFPEELKKLGGRPGDQGELICQSCHRVHGASATPLLVTTGETWKLCITCHRSQHAEGKEEARRKGVHPLGEELEKPVELADRKISRLDCLSCHRVHEGQPGTPLLPRLQDADTLCAHCHERQEAKDRKHARGKQVHPVNTDLKEPVKLDGKTIRRLRCRSCHSVHDGEKNTPSLVEDHRNGALCRHCHDGQTEVTGTDHDLRRPYGEHRNELRETLSKEGLCGGCHSLHRARRDGTFLYAGPELPEAPGLPRRDRLCLACHRKENPLDAKEVERYTHPWKDLILRSDPGVMPLIDEKGKITKFGRIGCITCHEPHRWHPGNERPSNAEVTHGNEEGTVLNSFLRRKGVSGTFCVDCHGPESHYKYKYFHDTQGREKQLEYIK